MDAGKDIATVGKAGVNLLITGLVVFGIAAVAFAGWNWSKRKAAEKANA